MGYILDNEHKLIQLSENQKTNRQWTLVYIRSGRGMYLTNGDLRALNEGDLLLFSPNESYSFASKDLGDEYNINLTASLLTFDSHWLDAVQTAFPSSRDLLLKVREVSGVYMIRGPKWIRISSLLEEMSTCQSHEQPIKLLAILELISTGGDMFLLGKSASADLLDPTFRRQSIDRYISTNYCKKISLEDISRYVGMSRTYFCNFFKSNYGEGFADYLNRLRVEKASVLLVSSDMTIGKIAQECGFTTLQYFTRTFAKVKHSTPAAFRRESKR